MIWISIDDAMRPLRPFLTPVTDSISQCEKQLSIWSGASVKRIGELEKVSSVLTNTRPRCGFIETCVGGRRARGQPHHGMLQRISVFSAGDGPRRSLIGLRIIVASKFTSDRWRLSVC